MKILHVVGARPNFMKLAPVLRASARHKTIKHVIVHSGQHYDFNMSESFFKDLDIPSPDYQLGIGSGTHGVQTGRMLERLDPILIRERPDVVLVYGDANTVLAALGSYKMHIPTGHVEAGLREGIWRPEEINRKVSDQCCDFLFCPTPTAVDNLRRENFEEKRIFFTGCITYDAYLHAMEISRTRSQILKQLGLTPNEYFLLTMHRAETVDSRAEVEGIIDALVSIEQRIIYPIHPRTKKSLTDLGLLGRVLNAGHITLLDPVGYYDLLSLLANCRLVITDSGGVLKEAYYSLKPCVMLDSTTEYDKEIFEPGYSILAGHGKKKILDSVDVMLKRHLAPPVPNPLGDGNAAKNIVDILVRHVPAARRTAVKD